VLGVVAEVARVAGGQVGPQLRPRSSSLLRSRLTVAREDVAMVAGAVVTVATVIARRVATVLAMLPWLVEEQTRSWLVLVASGWRTRLSSTPRSNSSVVQVLEAHPLALPHPLMCRRQ